ncbi:murein hydrolase activator EnvC family protein [Streptomyces sp. YIM S03343]
MRTPHSALLAPPALLLLSAALLTSTAALAAPAPRTGAPPRPAVWPVPGRPVVLRGWQPPSTPYGRGHRGIDLSAAPGTPIRAPAPARVTFAGRVAGTGVISLTLADTGTPPLRTTFEPVQASVRAGDQVTPGELIGTAEPPPTPPHCPTSCLHWGLLRGSTYLNPLSLLRRGPSRLLPVAGVAVP